MRVLLDWQPMVLVMTLLNAIWMVRISPSPMVMSNGIKGLRQGKVLPFIIFAHIVARLVQCQSVLDVLPPPHLTQIVVPLITPRLEPEIVTHYFIYVSSNSLFGVGLVESLTNVLSSSSLAYLPLHQTGGSPPTVFVEEGRAFALPTNDSIYRE